MSSFDSRITVIQEELKQELQREKHIQELKIREEQRMQEKRKADEHCNTMNGLK